MNTVEARKSLRFREIFDGDGMRIVVDAVAIGSEAEQVLAHMHYRAHSQSVLMLDLLKQVLCLHL